MILIIRKEFWKMINFRGIYNNRKRKNAEYLYNLIPYEEEAVWEINKNQIIVRFGNLYINIGEKDFIVKDDSGTRVMEAFEVINTIKLHFRPQAKSAILFTGAFNPPTIAHYHMIESALNIYPFSYVVFAISNQKFLDRKQKRNNDWAYSEKERLEMLLRMTSKIKNVLIMGVEKTCTYDALNEVKERYHSKNVFFALGSDKLKEIGRWKHHDELLSEFSFYILRRNDSMDYIKDKCEGLFDKTLCIIGDDNQDFKDISATEVRRKIDNGEDFTKLVHPAIISLLTKKSLAH